MKFVRAARVAARVGGVMARIVLQVAVGLALLVVLAVVLGRRLVVRVSSWWRDRRQRAATRTDGTVAPEESPCCGAGIIESNLQGYLCHACYEQVQGVMVAPATPSGSPPEETLPHDDGADRIEP